MVINAPAVGRVVLLNGPPSCGKTTLARALLPQLDDPWFHRSLDDFRAGYLDRYWLADDGTLFERVVHGYVGALRAMAVAGNNVIAEAVITPARAELYATTFRDLPVVVVAVRCPLELARERERARDDRVRGPIALPADAFEDVYRSVAHDVEIDTSVGAPDVLARVLAARLCE
jgi:chloramphenicol 3-O phosphotransferase